MTNFIKIISFLPSATEILFELGLGGNIKGVTHECTYPIEAIDIPKVISTSMEFDELDSLNIDAKVKEMSSKNQSMFNLDSNKIIEIKPDLLISQSLCTVCAPFDREIQEAYSILGYAPKNLVLNPKTIEGILDSILLLGKEVGNLEKAIKMCHQINQRIDKIRSVIEENVRDRTINRNLKVLCLDWINPFYIAGHWVPEMINIAGGYSVNATVGSDSKPIDILKISRCNPDKIILMPCGFNIDRTKAEYKKYDDISWKSLNAVKNKEVYVVDSNSYFSKPSHRFITGIEILCKILYPKIFDELQLPKNSFFRF